MTRIRRPIVIEHVRPAVDDGRYPVKRVVGDALTITADIFKEGHDLLAASIRFRAVGETDWRETPLSPVDNDGWAGSFPLEANTRYRYTVEAWTDTFGSWVEEMRRRLAGGQVDLTSELLEGGAMLARARGGARDADAAALTRALERLEAASSRDRRLDVLLDSDLRQVMARVQPRPDLTRHDRELEVVVDRPPAAFAAWYEMFPRSQGRIPGRHGAFDDCIDRLPAIRRMGFDVVYLPPIHPIGRTARKGPDNALAAGPGDPGSPWAIGGPEGGHTAVHPELGTLEDFRRLVKTAQGLGMEIALDFAIQCSPDHPWVREHPEWFYQRPDGTIKYAENPPKKYQDIYPINFASPAWESLWNALLGVVRFWIDQGVRTFRVDNPHTKPLDFWAWLIREVQDRDPDVVFLSEAFTRPKVMRALAKAGFTQSYTYFTWRNFKEELTEYLEELTGSEMAEYFRGNFFVNTPDILPEVLQRGGPPAFRMRAALAATLSSVWGIYSGYELCEATPLPGSEEYRASEKYEIRVRDWDAPGNISSYIAQLNTIRQENPALHRMGGLRFYPANSPHVLFYGKLTPARDNVILVAVNLDPFATHEAALQIPLAEIGIAPDETYELHELLGGDRRLVRGASHTVTLDPRTAPAHIYRVGRWRRRERDFDYYA
ncbi:MAG TPA: alpha-1,4-glucan--maltose-1-phosphate maltosyltransferase [Candidatus Acidoferrum sp.]|jgi:starch synthase (maltosyl-transferring)|nr:alpha-1,4-glucan--maltose-1-phosphate maltosyltransferase [Candidatus Acidoferrum sp.]